MGFQNKVVIDGFLAEQLSGIGKAAFAQRESLGVEIGKNRTLSVAEVINPECTAIVPRDMPLVLGPIVVPEGQSGLELIQSKDWVFEAYLFPSHSILDAQCWLSTSGPNYFEEAQKLIEDVYARTYNCSYYRDNARLLIPAEVHRVRPLKWVDLIGRRHYLILRLSSKS